MRIYESIPTAFGELCCFELGWTIRSGLGHGHEIMYSKATVKNHFSTGRASPVTFYSLYRLSDHLVYKYPPGTQPSNPMLSYRVWNKTFPRPRNSKKRSFSSEFFR